MTAQQNSLTCIRSCTVWVRLLVLYSEKLRCQHKSLCVRICRFLGGYYVHTLNHVFIEHRLMQCVYHSHLHNLFRFNCNWLQIHTDFPTAQEKKKLSCLVTKTALNFLSSPPPLPHSLQ